MSAIATPVTARPEAPPRRWPVFLFILLGLACYFGARAASSVQIEPERLIYVFTAGMMGPMACTLLLALYWVALGTGRFWNRLTTVMAAAAIGAVAVLLATEKTRMWIIWWGLPAAVALVATFAAFFWRAPARARYLGGALLGLAALAPWELIRVDGVFGGFTIDWEPRWAKGADEKTDLATTNEAITLPAEAGPDDWPGFRGARRDGLSTGRVGAIDPSALKERWRVNVGPGWGSVCVVGGYLFTQDQLPKEERVACYDAATGKRVWAYTLETRHEDWASGSGPRATPTYHDRKIYAMGAKGDVVCVDATNGKEVWKAALRQLAGEARPPDFGFSASPLVHGGRVYVHPGWGDGPRLLAFDAATGKQAFAEGEGANGYSSPQLATLAGVEQVLIFNDRGLFGHDLKTGKELWSYSWKAGQSNPTSLQPLALPGDRVLLGGGGVGQGTHCVQVKRDGEKWSAERAWRTTKFTPNFNDVIPHGDVIYGLDRSQLFCAEVATGNLRWVQGEEEKYGTGQLLGLKDALLVLGERGGLTLLPLPPDEGSKGVDVPALKGKTWNHPAFAEGRLFVRNGREMVCFEVVKKE